MTALTKDDIEHHIPASLANLATPPVFLLRPATMRDERAFRRALQLEGLTRHEPSEVRVEIKRGLQAKWSPDEFEQGWAILNDFWDGGDRLAEMPLETDEQKAEFEAAKAELDEIAPAAELLMTKLADVWPPLRRIVADNSDFDSDFHSVAIGMFVVGWKNVDLPYSRQADQVSLDTIYALRKKLVSIENDAIADKVEGVVPGLAYIQLANHVLASMDLNRGAEKNSESQSQSGPTPPPSTANSPMDGSSETSTSKKTPRGKSAKTTAS
jgi:hypothetical protein